MAATITVTEEARAFFIYKPDSDLQGLIDQAVREYSAFMGGLPLEIDAFGDEDSTYTQVYVTVIAPAGESLRGKHHEFMTEWRSCHTREELRAVGFSIHYL